ncbi:MAG: prolyl oligopeptidase family serine peptidase [Chloroflexi bacterium]|nr:prolyl oligopeptidase family serine peptidase [Chloroflexota bacterium]
MGTAGRTLDSADIYLSQDIYGFDLSPDGRTWAFLTLFDEAAEEARAHGTRGDLTVRPIADLTLMPADGGYPQPFHLGHLTLSNPHWSPDGHSLAFGGRDGLWIASTRTGKARCVARERVFQLNLGEVSTPIRQLRFDSLWADVLWRPDGHQLLYITDDEGTQQFWLVAEDGSTKIRLRTVEGQVVSRQWSPDGRSVLFTARDWDGNTGGIWLLDADSRQAQRLSVENDCFYARPLAAWTPKGDMVVFRSNRTGYAKLWTMRPDGTQVSQLTYGANDDTLFRLAPDNVSVAYASRNGCLGSEDIWSVPLSGGEPRRLTSQPGINRPLAWSEDCRTLYYFHSSPTEPGDLYSIREMDPSPQRLTVSRPPWLVGALSWPEEVQVACEGGCIYTLIYKPPDFDPDRHYPAVIWIKGGPTTSSRLAYEPLLHWLAGCGYVVACPNYRGSIGFGVEHMNGGARGQAGLADLNDIATVAQYVKSLTFVDGEHVGVAGKSWGGYMTLMAITHYPDVFSCAVAHSAIYDWSIQQAEENVRHYSYWLYGGWANEIPEHFADRSPITLADQIRTPLLITHGKADKNVPFVQVKAFVERARAAGAEIETQFYENEGHGLKLVKNRSDYHQRTAQFLDKHLKPWDFRTNPRRGQNLE